MPTPFRLACLGRFILAGFSVCFACIFLACQSEIKPYQPQWEVGDVTVYDVRVELKAALANTEGNLPDTQPSQPTQHSQQSWAEQFMRMKVTVESFDTASALVRIQLDSVFFRSAERDSLEAAFLSSHMQGFSARMRLYEDGRIDSLDEEPALPLATLGPAFLSPSRLWIWLWPTWPLSVSQSSPSASWPLQGWSGSPCLWQRGQNQLSPIKDTATWVLEWPITPVFAQASDSATCTDLPWQGLARMQGERQGLGLKEFKWQARASTPDGGLMLERSVVLQKR